MPERNMKKTSMSFFNNYPQPK